MSNREELLERALQEAKRSLGEVVDEVVYCEKELEKYKAANSKLQERIREMQQQQGEGNGESNAVRSLKQMLLQQQEQFTLQKRDLIQRAEARIRELEQQQQQPQPSSNPSLELATERSLRQDLERSLQTIKNERDQARSELLTWSISNNVSLQEGKATLEQKRQLSLELEKFQRQAESALREQRASEKRFEALREEMHQVMEERDEVNASCELFRNQKHAEAAQAAQLKSKLEEATQLLETTRDHVRHLEQEQVTVSKEKESWARLRMQMEADMDVLRTTNASLQLEKELALRENQGLLERLDQALGARRLAVAARGEAQKQVDDMRKSVEDAEARQRADEKRMQDLDALLRESREETVKLKTLQNNKNAELRDAFEAVKEYKELKEEAEREVEAARRQIKGLNEEMLACLKARDLAFSQRDEAFSRLGSSIPRLQDHEPPSSAQQQQQQQQRQRIQELESQLDPRHALAQERRIHELESQLNPLHSELDDLRRESKEMEQALRGPLEANRRELSRWIAECEALKETRNSQAQHIRELQAKVQQQQQQQQQQQSMSTPSSNLRTTTGGENTVLRDKLRNLMTDFDRVESENRRLKGLM